MNVMLNFRSSITGLIPYSTTQFVPKHNPVKTSDIDVFKYFINNHKKVLVLTGAGISTESGIPDYRSEEVGLYARSNHKPVQFQDFVKKSYTRKRYWARNFVGWPRFSEVLPNTTHLTLARLENQDKKVFCVITQNVDNLHFKAGSQNVIELHGSSYRVKCLNCNFEISRHDFQKALEILNPNMKETSSFIRPDGDVELSDEQVQDFVLPDCDHCGGILKPDIVFFGDNVPKARVQNVEKMVKQCDSVLVLGSSLSVFSSYRIILQSFDLKRPIYIVNIGPTRGDKYACQKINVKCSDVFSAIS